MREVLLSVGIDIGTSTTQIIFSNITIEDLSSGFTVPRIEIIDKEILYRSEIWFTPLLSPTEINMIGVRDIVEKEYRKAGVNKEDIKTGAVVITGEAARKQNANEVLHHLSDFAGDFVVATAGPDLESIIAARGAGADRYSSEKNTTAANYDIGGGTSNFAMFNRGQLIGTSCLDIGGRLVRLDPSHQNIEYISPKVQQLCQHKDISIKVGDPVNVNQLREVTKAMCEVLEMSLGLVEKSSFYPTMLTEEHRDIDLTIPLENICFSGGVADYIYGETPKDDLFRYGDIGILLGEAIRQSDAISSNLHIFKAGETIRATVVGAGSHITDISGSTIEYDPELLPIKNIPILKLAKEDEQSPQTVTQAITKKLDWYRAEDELQLVAVAFDGKRSPSFQEVNELADALMVGMKPLLDMGMPLITITENDMAKVLGQTIRAKMPNNNNFICIDAIRVDNGDYIDIGAPAVGGNVLPVVIKTLLFK